ncbi:hypothetical protein R6Q59_024946 [Mikania micrantha]|uniref:Uncharacterized protein n=1 Tax=Mikania micrantha TaxID=192012 RepID=A0A5N6P9P7_9ASTR|nr:hypothetical protein E3N88_10034 [Mikania micrantha]
MGFGVFGKRRTTSVDCEEDEEQHVYGEQMDTMMESEQEGNEDEHLQDFARDLQHVLLILNFLVFQILPQEVRNMYACIPSRGYTYSGMDACQSQYTRPECRHTMTNVGKRKDLEMGVTNNDLEMCRHRRITLVSY